MLGEIIDSECSECQVRVYVPAISFLQPRPLNCLSHQPAQSYIDIVVILFRGDEKGRMQGRR
jgi:hypothetical protein